MCEATAQAVMPWSPLVQDITPLRERGDIDRLDTGCLADMLLNITSLTEIIKTTDVTEKVEREFVSRVWSSHQIKLDTSTLQCRGGPLAWKMDQEFQSIFPIDPEWKLGVELVFNHPVDLSPKLGPEMKRQRRH